MTAEHMQTLHITNGDSAVHNLMQAGFGGTFLPVRDAYHVGPLLPDDDFLAVPSARCRFIVSQGWASEARVKRFQRQRRDILSHLDAYRHIMLWFEHDLYDQLQLLRVLHFFNHIGVDLRRISLVVTDQFLGEADDETCQELWRFQEPLSAEHLRLGSHIWQQLTTPEPTAWPQLLQLDLALLPFVKPALHRFFAEFPSSHNGLSLTAQTALEMLSEPESAGRLFARVQAAEPASFMGDTLFFNLLESMNQGPAALLHPTVDVPLLEKPEQPLSLTTLGHQVVTGERHYLDVSKADFWLGGVNICATDLWCYDHTDQSFQRRTP